ncbi:uncharacterized protein [Notothenia coriiceps]|uniref:Ig-like domain-containing protein n=1 Tax=Notothenia coriiceps TaxID=8208 RepID=A0A6I9N9F8_9TELE|nr:PREDICTED: uncharacterized protein LOC104946627 [Notothenia coriiceps]
MSEGETPLGQALQRLAHMQETATALQRQQSEALLGITSSQREDRALLRELLQRPAARESDPATNPARPPSIALQKLTAEDDPEAYLDIFEGTAAACGWPEEEWAARLLPLLSGSAQLAAHSLPAASRHVYRHLRKAILDRLGTQTIAVLLLCSLSWICVSSESQTVDVSPGEEVSLLCSNFSSAVTQIMWFRVVKTSEPRCVSHMFEPLEPASFCEGFKKEKFEMTSNLSTISLKIKQVNLSDSGLYFCGYKINSQPLIIEATYLDVQEDGSTKLLSYILCSLIMFLIVIVICMAVKINKLQKANVEEQNPQPTEVQGSDDLINAAVTFRLAE